MEMVGKVLGNRYEIIEKIGTGGMATVYKARCRTLNRNVAIKILKDEFANDAEFIKRFQIEAQSAASLSHQNIVSIFDVSREESVHYIVMELIEGKTLKEIIKEKGKIPWEDAVKIAAQIAAGLNQAHTHHIIHRDIKPHNIIITKEGVAKVTDFGIAKVVSNSTINAFGSTIGSVHYFSPEHARGGYTDEKSDLYSLGVVLYEMCTGKLPFEAETPVSVALKHLQEQPEEPKKINNEIPDALNMIILKAMQKDISSRYQSAKELYDDLTKLLKNPEDTSLLKNVATNKEEFPTQKIPTINNFNKINTQEEKVNEKNEKNIEQDDDLMGRKKGVTKKQALVRLVVFLVIAIGLFFTCVYMGSMISEKILGANTTVEMIEIVGYSEEQAEEMLSEIGLKMNVVGYVTSNEYPLPGFITYQERAKGYRLKSGDTIDVRISKGGAKVLVPDVSQYGSTIAAKTQIEKNGDLKYVEDYEFHDVIPSGDIVRQEPLANSEVDVGSVVTVFISKGPASGDTGLVVVPNVVGESEENAIKILNEANLIPTINRVTDKTKEEGIVLKQTPASGEYQTQLGEVELEINGYEGSNTSTSGEQKPKEQPNSTGNQGETKPLEAKRKVTVDLGKVGQYGEFNVKVVLEGDRIGKRVEYDEEHTRDDGKIDVYVTDVKNSLLKVYIDGTVLFEKTMY